MKSINHIRRLFAIFVVLSIVNNSYGENSRKPPHPTVEEDPLDTRKRIIWCTVSAEEQQKCNHLAMAVERDRIRVGYDYYKFECKLAFNKDECMELMDSDRATMTSLDAGEVFVGGRYTSLVPILQEVGTKNLKYHFAVAVVKKGSLNDVHNIASLRGKKACFAGVGTMAGWVIPVYTLMKEGGMQIIDCNNHVKSATHFFGPSCAVNALVDKYNPIGDNSDKLCQICIGKIPGGRCTDSDPYAGYDGAFRCLLEVGEVAFLRHTTVPELTAGAEFSSVSKDTFELLCNDGSRRPIDSYQDCNWGAVPSDAIVTSSALSFDIRKNYQKLMQKLAEMYGGEAIHDESNDAEQFDEFGNPRRLKRQSQGNFDRFDPRGPDGGFDPNDANRGFDPYHRETNVHDPYDPHRNQDPYGNRDRFDFERSDPYGRPINTTIDHNRDFNRFNPSGPQAGQPYEQFNMFESSPRYGIHGNLLFQDTTRNFAFLTESQQTFSGFLGQSMEIIMGVRECPVDHMTLCVTSDQELEKCVKMKTAIKAQLLKPEMRCEKAHSQINCMQKIRSGSSDVAIFDAGDIYTAGLNFDLVPFISEVYNLAEPEYYVVAVAKESDPDTELTYLREKFTCHGGINTAAGWIYPLAYLLSNGWIRPYGCNSIRAAAEYFTKSCVPGALSTEYNTGVPYDNLCDLCHGAAFRYCRRDASEDYYGHTGAFRCLVEGGGHVAFVKHTTVDENTGGKRREWWARDALIDDFELLCPDGTRAEIQDYHTCNLGKVKANAIVTRGGYAYNETQINAYINLFLYAQTFYGRKTADEFSFSMFSSTPPFTDLIFQDATLQLKIIAPQKRYYSAYLGEDFMRARRVVDCYAHATNVHISKVLFSILFVFTLITLR